MRVPKPPVIPPVDSISPTVYEAALRCLSRASWAASDDGRTLPPSPRSLLGIGVHSVLERAARLGISATTEGDRVRKAARHFDEQMKRIFQRSHPLVRAKFGSPERIPFYNLYRARATRIAAQMPRTYSGFVASATAKGREPNRLAEFALKSRDHAIRGRPDLIDAANATVVDYKTGSAPDLQQPSDSEARQLRLYAYLAMENGIAIRRGAIERPNRIRIEMPISEKDAEDEGRRAREALTELNRVSGRRFSEAASPSPGACRHCPCIPFCPAFWESSIPSWEEECGTQVEGVVESIEGDALVSLHLHVHHGTGTRGPGVISRLSREWLEVEQTTIPESGQTVRLTDARQMDRTAISTEFRADRATTALWTV